VKEGNASGEEKTRSLRPLFGGVRESFSERTGTFVFSGGDRKEAGLVRLGGSSS